MTQNQEVAPEGFEHIVQALKDNPDINNPFAVAWAMKNQGYEPRTRDGKEREPQALWDRFRFESNGSAALGMLMRKGVAKPMQEAARMHVALPLRAFTPLREAALGPLGNDGLPTSARVVLITEGPGNSANKNFYPADALRKSFRAFEGRKCFLDHPSVDEEQNRPERTVREICGWFSDTEVGAVNGRTAILANLNFSGNNAGREARELIESELRYQTQFPSSEDVLVGLSINAAGPSHEELIDQEAWNVVEAFESAFSVDLVTFPARGGRAVALREADRYRFRRDFERQLASSMWRKRLEREVSHAA